MRLRSRRAPAAVEGVMLRSGIAEVFITKSQAAGSARAPLQS